MKATGKSLSQSNIGNNGKSDSELLKKKTSDLKSQHRYISYQLSLPEKIQRILSSKPFIVIDIIITLWMFYSNDFKILYTDKEKFMGQNNYKAPDAWEGYRTEGPGL